MGDQGGSRRPTDRCRSVHRTSSVAHRRGHLSVPIEVGSHLGTALAACGADQARLDVRQPCLIRPAIRAQGNVVAAEAAIDQDAPDAHLAHLGKGNLDRATIRAGRGDASWARHPAKNARAEAESNCRLLAARKGGELLPVVGVDNNGALKRRQSSSTVSTRRHGRHR